MHREDGLTNQSRVSSHMIFGNQWEARLRDQVFQSDLRFDIMQTSIKQLRPIYYTNRNVIMQKFVIHNICYCS